MVDTWVICTLVQVEVFSVLEIQGFPFAKMRRTKPNPEKVPVRKVKVLLIRINVNSILIFLTCPEGERAHEEVLILKLKLIRITEKNNSELRYFKFLLLKFWISLNNYSTDIPVNDFWNLFKVFSKVTNIHDRSTFKNIYITSGKIHTISANSVKSYEEHEWQIFYMADICIFYLDYYFNIFYTYIWCGSRASQRISQWVWSYIAIYIKFYFDLMLIYVIYACEKHVGLFRKYATVGGFSKTTYLLSISLASLAPNSRRISVTDKFRIKIKS